MTDDASEARALRLRGGGAPQAIDPEARALRLRSPIEDRALSLRPTAGPIENPLATLARTQEQAEPGAPAAADLIAGTKPGESVAKTALRVLPETLAQGGQLVAETAGGISPGAGRAAFKLAGANEVDIGSPVVSKAAVVGRGLMLSYPKLTNLAGSVATWGQVKNLGEPTQQEIQKLAATDPNVGKILAGVKQAQTASMELAKDRDDDAVYYARKMLENELRVQIMQQAQDAYDRRMTIYKASGGVNIPVNPRFGPGRSPQGGIAAPQPATKDQIDAMVRAAVDANAIPGIHRPPISDEEVTSRTWEIYKAAEAGRVADLPKWSRRIGEGIGAGVQLAVTGQALGLSRLGASASMLARGAAQGAAFDVAAQGLQLASGARERFDPSQAIASTTTFGLSSAVGGAWAKSFMRENMPKWVADYGDIAEAVLADKQKVQGALLGVKPAVDALNRIEAGASLRGATGTLGTMELIGIGSDLDQARKEGRRPDADLIGRILRLGSMVVSSEALGGTLPSRGAKQAVTASAEQVAEAARKARAAVVDDALRAKMDESGIFLKQQAAEAQQVQEAQKPPPDLMDEDQALARLGRRTERDAWSAVADTPEDYKASQQALAELEHRDAAAAQKKDMLEFAEHYSDRLTELELKKGGPATPEEEKDLYDKIVKERAEGKPKDRPPEPPKKRELPGELTKAHVDRVIDAQRELAATAVHAPGESTALLRATKALSAIVNAKSQPEVEEHLNDLVDEVAEMEQRRGERRDKLAAQGAKGAIGAADIEEALRADQRQGSAVAKALSAAMNFAFRRAMTPERAKEAAQLVLEGSQTILVQNGKARTLRPQEARMISKGIDTGEIKVGKASFRQQAKEVPESHFVLKLKDGRTIKVFHGGMEEGRLEAFKTALRTNREAGAVYVPGQLGSNLRSPEEKLADRETDRVMSDFAARMLWKGSVGVAIEKTISGITRAPVLGRAVRSWITGDFTPEEIRQKVAAARKPFNEAYVGVDRAARRLDHELTVAAGGDRQLRKQIEGIAWVAVRSGGKIADPAAKNWVDPVVKRVTAAMQDLADAGAKLGKVGTEYDALPEARYLVKRMIDGEEAEESISIRKSQYDSGEYDRNVNYGELVGGTRFFEKDGYLADFYNIANEVDFDPVRLTTIAGERPIGNLRGIVGNATLQGHLHGRTRSAEEAIAGGVKKEVLPHLELLNLERESFARRALLFNERKDFGAQGLVRTDAELPREDEEIPRRIEIIRKVDEERAANNAKWKEMAALPEKDRDIFAMAELKARNLELLKERETALKSLTKAGWVRLEGKQWGNPKFGGFEGMYVHRDLIDQIPVPKRRAVAFNMLYSALHRMAKSARTVGNFLRIGPGNSVSNKLMLDDMGLSPFTPNGLRAAVDAMKWTLHVRWQKKVAEDPLHEEFLAYAKDSSLGFSGEIHRSENELDRANRALDRAKLGSNSLEFLAAWANKASAHIEAWQDSVPGYGFGRQLFRMSDEMDALTGYLILRRHGIHGSRPLSPDEAWDYVRSGFDLSNTTDAIQAAAHAFSFIRYRAKVIEAFATRALARRPTVLGMKIPMPVLDAAIRSRPGGAAAQAAVATRGAVRFALQMTKLLGPIALARHAQLANLGISDDEWKRITDKRYQLYPEWLRHLAAMYAVPAWKNDDGSYTILQMDKMTAGMAVLNYVFDNANNTPFLWTMLNKNVLAGPILQTSFGKDYTWSNMPSGVLPADSWGRQERGWPIFTTFMPGILASNAQAFAQYWRDPMGEKAIRQILFDQLGLPLKRTDSSQGIPAVMDELLAKLKKLENEGRIGFDERDEGGKTFYLRNPFDFGAALPLRLYAMFKATTPRALLSRTIHMQNDVRDMAVR